MKQKTCGLIVFLMLWQLVVTAQNNYAISLQQAIDTALANNIGVKQNALLSDAAFVNLKQARNNVLPDLNISLDHGMNQGRSIDPFTNAYVNQSVNYAGYGVGSGVVLFNGMNLQNRIRQNAFAYDASKMELQVAKDALTLNVILAYLQVLNNEDLMASSQKQKELSAKQLERLQILDRQGAIAPALLSDLKGQLLNDELNILNLKNNVAQSKLALAQLMNIVFNPNMVLQRIDAGEFLTAFAKSSNDVYQQALQQFAQIKSVALRKKSAEYNVKALRGNLYPTVVLGGNLQTAYSSAAQNANGKIPYTQQVENNIFSGINLGLRIPIFNSFRAKNNIRLANIALKNTELIEEATRVQLRQQIEQAHLNMTNAYDRYKTVLEQVAAYTISFNAAEARFNAGVGNSVDYLIAKNNLDRANINLISAQYDFVLRKKVLDYYDGVGLR